MYFRGPRSDLDDSSEVLYGDLELGSLMHYLRDLGNPVKIVIRRSRNSFFGKISELANSKILVHVQKKPSSSEYHVIALSSKPETLKVARKLVSYDHYLRKVKIKKITYHYANDYTVIYAIKSMCEFYKLIEENKISILSPYLFNKGRREYIVIGSSKAVANYLADLRNYYGEDNVTWQALALEDLVKELVKTSILNLIEEKLTSSEKRTLLIAYKYGYFDYPKNAKQEDLGSVLNLSKVTISIHIRKALKKIMNQIIGIFEES